MLKLVGLGGTFDHLHKGHKFLIKTALNISKKVVIGLATESLLRNKKYRNKIESYNIRKQNLEKFISEFTDLNRVEIIKLDDPLGPPAIDPKYEGLVVSSETYQGALKINEIRESRGLKPLIIIVIPMIKDKDNRKISSTSIREKLN
ncbi:MAG: phosphopantetheine adenylyltransferase [Promethearchaeota archaeon]